VQITKDTPIQNLLGNILELKNGISEIHDYLDPASETAPLPLGLMGQIMAQQLSAEGNVLAFHAEQLKTRKSNEWELARHSSVLRNKVSLLITFATIITQLSTADFKIQSTAAKLSQRVIERCQQVEDALEAVTSAAVISRRTLQNA
jgi:hypothetical protein